MSKCCNTSKCCSTSTHGPVSLSDEPAEGVTIVPDDLPRSDWPDGPVVTESEAQHGPVESDG